MVNKWVEHVKKYAKDNNMTYGCALSDPKMKESYIKVKVDPVKHKKTSNGKGMRDIINNAGVFNYYIDGKLFKLLSTSEKEAKKEILLKINKNPEKFINKEIMLMHLEKIPSTYIKGDKNSSLKLLGGPIVVDITVYKIDKKGNLFIDENEDRNNKVFFTDDYLTKNEKIKKKDLEKIANYAIAGKIKRKLLSVFTIDTLDEYINKHSRK